MLSPDTSSNSIRICTRVVREYNYRRSEDQSRSPIKACIMLQTNPHIWIHLIEWHKNFIFYGYVHKFLFILLISLATKKLHMPAFNMHSRKKHRNVDRPLGRRNRVRCRLSPTCPFEIRQQMLETWRLSGLTRARPGGGGAHMCPHRFFADSRKMAERSAAKFGIAVHSSFAHLV